MENEAMTTTGGGLLVDVIIVLLALLFAINGYRQGFIISAGTFLGFLGGALAGVQLAPFAADIYTDPLAKLDPSESDGVHHDHRARRPRGPAP
jgi:hypothetical protein